MMSAMKMAIVLALLIAPASAAASGQTEQVSANPMRRVVTMLQMMQNKIEAEGEKQKEVHDKFMCWCTTGAGELAASIDAAGSKVPQVVSAIESDEAALAQTKADLKSAQEGREAAKAAMAEATSVREKEAAKYAADYEEATTNLSALKKATAAIEKGMGSAFLQTKSAQVLKNIVVNTEKISDFDRDQLVSFLSADQTSGDQSSGQILGMLKAMGDTMTKDLDELVAAEEAAKKTYGELMAAKTKEVEALTTGIEEKIIRIGDLGVEIAQEKEDLDDTQKGLLDDRKFLADLDKNCALEKEAFAASEKMRGEEQLAIADTIKILNDDDALELFKKTLASSSFIQEKVTSQQMRSEALALLKDARHKGKHSDARVPLELITMALAGKKVDFTKVLGMIDELVDVLKKEQQEDDHQKEYCDMILDQLEDKKKELEHTSADLDKLIADTTEKIATTTDEIAALEDGIKTLDKDVAEATENRKEENEDYTDLMTSNTAAKELIGFAKNRLNKFYNPKQYKAPPKRVLTEEERITLNMGGTLAPTAAPGGIAGTGVTVFAQISMHRSDDVVAPPPPPAASAAYKSKGEESGGVMAMMDAMVADLDKEMQTAEVEEKNAQEEYEEFMSDSAEKRALDSKAITDKSAAKAQMEGELAKANTDKQSTVKELMATMEALSGVHGECDWLMENYESRKSAREGEVESLKKAKSVLSGADFSLMQQSSARRSKRLTR